MLSSESLVKYCVNKTSRTACSTVSLLDASATALVAPVTSVVPSVAIEVGAAGRLQELCKQIRATAAAVLFKVILDPLKRDALGLFTGNHGFVSIPLNLPVIPPGFLAFSCANSRRLFISLYVGQIVWPAYRSALSSIPISMPHDEEGGWRW
jgi:hypothetical protein